MAGLDDKTKTEQQPDKTIEIEADKPLEPVEITLTDDGDGTVIETKDDGKQSPQKPEKKQTGRFQQKINQERALRSEAETTAQRLQRENEELKARLEKTSSDFDVTNRAAFNNHADNVEARLKLAKQDLVAATNAGDAEKIAEATAEVSQWGAEKARVDAWKRSHPEPTEEERRAQQARKPEADKPEPQQRQQRFTPELQAFLDRSPWFTPGTKTAPNDEFDVDMHTEARNYATTLERRYKRDGREKDIGTEGYYADIEKHMQEEFPDYDWGDVSSGADDEPPPSKGALPKMNGDQRQISTRSASNGAQQQSANSNKITLSGEQRGFVRSMVDQGAYGNNPKTGKPYTYAEAEVRYAREVLKDRELQKQKLGG